jgi:membrane-associated protease RseP (regulator of RpoE activity)
MKVDLTNSCAWLCGLAVAGILGLAPERAAQAAASALILTAEDPVDQDDADEKKIEGRKVFIKTVEPDGSARKHKKEVAWLGVATEEASEAIASQLGLKAGEGLTVSFVSPDSPAAKAGLKKNDVLLELDDQLLVHPAQFRKLIQMRKEGDTVKITFFRAAKKQSLSATLGKTMAAGFGDLRALELDLRNLPVGEAVKDQMKAVQQALAQAGVDKQTLRVEIQRNMEQVRKTLQDVLRQATNAHRTFGPAAREFQELARRGLDVEKDATVIVKSKRDSVKTVVKTDDTGTYVIVASPKKRLTAHDKDGKLLFDGEIETSEQQSNVPEDVWKKAQPMVEQLNGDKIDKPDAEDEEKEGI